MKLSCKVPERCALAFSGGSDSCGALWFLTRKPGRLQDIIFVNHGTEFSNIGERFVEEVVDKFYKEFGIKLNLFIHKIEESEKNKEAIWHQQRSELFQNHNIPVITAHSLDDQVEQFLLTTLKSGNFYKIPPINRNIYRPFLFMTRDKLIDFARRLPFEYLSDPSNFDIRYHRAFVRHCLIPKIKDGMGLELKTVVLKMIGRTNKNEK